MQCSCSDSVLLLTKTRTHGVEVNSTLWSSERCVHAASQPSIRKMVMCVTANRTITATTVDASSSSAASNILSQRKSVVLANAYLANAFHDGASVVQSVSPSRGYWVFSSSALRHCRIICMSTRSPASTMSCSSALQWKPMHWPASCRTSHSRRSRNPSNHATRPTGVS